MSIDPGVDAFLAEPISRSRVPVEPPPRIEHNLPAGREVPLIQPGSDEWYLTVSASKIAAIVGLSPYDSPLSLWAKMTGKVAREAQNDAMMRGHYLEPAIAAWFRDQHPDWMIRPSGSWVAAGNDRHTATPDRHVHKPGDDARTQYDDLLQIKSTTKGYEWGQPGTDQIPDYYRVQVLWEAYVRGASRVHVAVIGPFLDFAEYVIDYDPAEVVKLVAAADAFLALVDSGTPPSIDNHGATFETVRELHPDIDADAKVEIAEPLARRYVTAIAAAKAAKEEETGAKTAVLDAMGDAKKATYDGKPLAGRQQRGTGAPFLSAAKKLPSFGEVPAAHEASTEREYGRESGRWRRTCSCGSHGIWQREGTPITEDHVTSMHEQHVRTADEKVADTSDTAPGIARIDWVKGRIVAVRDCGDPKAAEALAKFWPADVGKKAAEWTAADLDALDALLAQIETVDAVPFPATDPAKPTPAETLAADLAAKAAEETAANLRNWPIDDDGTPATKAQDADLRAGIAPMTAAQKATLQAWEADGKIGGRPWRYNDQATRRVAAINAAAISGALHLVDGHDDAMRCALSITLGVDLQPAWSTGALLGALTYDQAENLTSLAQRFAAGDEGAVTAIGDGLARHYADLSAS